MTMPQNNSAPSQHSGDALEAKLAADLHHTLKLVPSSQRELFVYELAKYWEAEKQAYAEWLIGEDDDSSSGLYEAKPWKEFRNQLRAELRTKAKLTPNKD